MIKFKDTWSAMNEPRLSLFWRDRYGFERGAPKHPEKFITTTDFEVLLTLNDGDSIDNALLNDKHNFLLENLEVRIVHYKGGEDQDCSYEVSLGKHVTKTEENKQYDAQLKLYEKEIVEYKKALLLYQEEVSEWRAWRAQEDKAALDKKINDAKLLLIEQGFKVTNE